MNGPVDITRPSSFVPSASESNLEFKAQRFSAPLFLEVSTNLRTSSVRDLPGVNCIEKLSRCQDVFFYATDQSPIVKALSRMDTSAKETILCKF